MDKIKLVDKLRNRTNISYEEARSTLENSNWDILDAMVYLENSGKVKKPSVSEFYTNDYKQSYINESYGNNGEVMKVDEAKGSNNSKGKNDFEGFFEAMCKAIDTCNNIFLEIRRRGRVLLRFPLTVLILLLFFAFWVIIPLMIVGLFFEIEYLVSTKRVNTDKIDKVNKVFNELSKGAKDIIKKITSYISS